MLAYMLNVVVIVVKIQVFEPFPPTCHGYQSLYFQ